MRIVKSTCIVLWASSMFFGCATVNPSARPAATRPASARPAATRPQATRPEPKSHDYLERGVALAALSMTGGGYSEVGYYPVKILGHGAPATSGPYKVKCLIQSTDVNQGDVKVTKNVILESRPAVAKDLVQGRVVLFVPDANPRSAATLRSHSVWHRGVVVATSGAHADRAKIMFLWHLDRKDESDRLSSVPLQNIRAILKPAIQPVQRFAK